MICAWKELLFVVPERIRPEIDKIGKDEAQEIRLRLGQPPALITQNRTVLLSGIVTREDLQFCINAASRYSPWAALSAEKGYITAAGGHRIGLCGEAAVDGGKMKGLSRPTSLCIRIARDYSGIGKELADFTDSILFLGRPGSGKTTLLRDVIRQISNRQSGSVSVVDERGELFPLRNGQPCFDPGNRTDILQGCAKAEGIDKVLRTMGPGTIAVDEITSEEDCIALMQAGWCGVQLLATAHGASLQDLRSRPVYKPLYECGLFPYAVILDKNKSWHLERMGGYI